MLRSAEQPVWPVKRRVLCGIMGDNERSGRWRLAEQYKVSFLQQVWCGLRRDIYNALLITTKTNTIHKLLLRVGVLLPENIQNDRQYGIDIMFTLQGTHYFPQNTVIS